MKNVTGLRERSEPGALAAPTTGPSRGGGVPTALMHIMSAAR